MDICDAGPPAGDSFTLARCLHEVRATMDNGSGRIYKMCKHLGATCSGWMETGDAAVYDAEVRRWLYEAVATNRVGK